MTLHVARNMSKVPKVPKSSELFWSPRNYWNFGGAGIAPPKSSTPFFLRGTFESELLKLVGGLLPILGQKFQKFQKPTLAAARAEEEAE
jgi:hypothetical protein